MNVLTLFCYIGSAYYACIRTTAAAYQVPRSYHSFNRKISLQAEKSDLSLHSANNDNEPLRQAIDKLASIIDPIYANNDSTTPWQSSTVVHIIGTGLCPTLLNLPLSTLQILSQADVVLYDSLGLSYEDIIQIVPPYCEVIGVGKRGDRASWKQSDIDDLIVQKATEEDTSSSSFAGKNKNIVRLKGGDPFLFGRTRTEIETLRSNNIQYTYTPNISSCIAGPHLGGIPLTDPTLDCQSFGVWSGTDAFGKSWGLCGDKDKEWSTSTGLGVDVLVFLMIGRLDKLDALCKLIANGNNDTADNGKRDSTGKWNTDTPCAIIQNAGGIQQHYNLDDDDDDDSTSLPVQRVWRSTLGDIVSVIKEEDETRASVSPAVFVVGATAKLDLR